MNMDRPTFPALHKPKTVTRVVGQRRRPEAMLRMSAETVCTSAESGEMLRAARASLAFAGPGSYYRVAAQMAAPKGTR